MGGNVEKRYQNLHLEAGHYPCSNHGVFGVESYARPPAAAASAPSTRLDHAAGRDQGTGLDQRAIYQRGVAGLAIPIQQAIEEQKDGSHYPECS